MSFRGERFNNGMYSLDAMTSQMTDLSKATIFSDRGEGVERMIDAIDYDLERESAAEAAAEQRRREKLFEAEMRLVDAGLKHLIPTLLLIVENGADFKASIRALAKTSKSWNAARKKYFEHRLQLIQFFQK